MELRKRWPLLSLLMVLPGLACSGGAPASPPAHTEMQSSAIAVLNGETIERAEFDTYLAFIQGELNEDPAPTPTLELFRDFLTRKLLMQEAKKEGITVSSDQVEEHVAEWMLPEQQVEPNIRNHVYEFLVTQRFLRRKVLDGIEVTQRELQQYYANHAQEYVVEDQAHVREILVDSREEANQVLAELQRLPAIDNRNFQAVARLRSKGITAESGGDLGIFARGDLPDEFEKAIFALKPGEISKPFQSGHGFHIFYLEEWIPKHDQKFYEVRRRIFDELTAEKERLALEAFLDRKFKESSVVIRDPNLRLDLGEKSSDEPVD